MLEVFALLGDKVIAPCMTVRTKGSPELNVALLRLLCHPRMEVLWHVWHPEPPCKALCTALTLRMDRTTSTWPEWGFCREMGAEGGCSRARSHADVSQHCRAEPPGIRAVVKPGEELCQAAGRGHAVEVGVGSQIKEGNSQLYKCSAAQKRLPRWLQDYCSNFDLLPK